MAKSGRPKRFKNGEELVSLWADFCGDIIEGGFQEVPTQTAFCRWLGGRLNGTDRRTIYNSLHKYFPEIKKEFEQLQSDVIMQGAMQGRYQPTMSIFGLKNWCGWGDGGRFGSGMFGEERKEDALSKALREEAERMNNANQ